MKTSTNKPRKSNATSITRGEGFFSTARSPGFFSPVMRKAGPKSSATEAGLTVSKPTDPLEKEADRTADTVMRMPAPEHHTAEAGPHAPLHRAHAGSEPPPTVQRAAAGEPLIQRFGEGTPTVAADAGTGIIRSTTGGQALPGDVRAFMEPRLNTDLADVRIHADESAASLSNHLSARAFTYRNHVFFGRDQYQPGTDTGRHLLAHELTHTIQQGASIQRATASSPPVTTTGSTPAVQRFGLQDALDYFADKAYNIPGYRMLTLVIGFNPINQRSTPRTAANFLRALIELIPGGALIAQALDNHGVINKAADWVERQVATLGDIGSDIVDGLKRFIDSLSWRDIFDLGGVWDRAKPIFTDPIRRLLSFGAGVVTDLLGMVKQAILRPLAALAEGTRGYDLLKAILAQDPITGEPFPRTAETLIGGFMKLISQEEVWENIRKGNATARAFAWFQGALAGLMRFVRSIPGRLLATLQSLTFADVISVAGAFRKIGSAFLGLAAEFGGWALNQVISLLEILFSVVAPGVMPYIAKAKAAFQTILRDPIRFVGNLVRAGKLGFEMFATNILTHLKNALIKWLVGPLADAGVYIPRSFDLLEIIKLVLSVLGLTWSAIRAKLVKIIPDPVLTGLEKTAGVLVTLVTAGPAAAWEQIKSELSELKDQLISQVSSMIQTEVVKAAVKKLVMMLNPAGAVIQAIVAIYDTVTFFIEKAKQIGAVVASFIDSIAAIAAGVVGPAAARLEQTLANTLVVVIGFLAKFAGLGGIPDKLVGIVKKIRQPIDRGLDKIVAWLGAMLSKLVAKAKETAKKFLEWWKAKIPITGGDEPHTLTFTGERKSAKLVVQSDPVGPVEFMKRGAKSKNISAAESAEPIATTETQVDHISTLISDLRKFDENGPTPSGTEADKADIKAKSLDRALRKLARHFETTFDAWGVKDDIVDGLVLSREDLKVKWTFKAKKAIADMHTERADLRKDKTHKKLVNLRAGLDRRHVVSMGDIGDHYERTINKKRISEAKLLLEQRSSIPDALITFKGRINANAIKSAAIRRWKKFFGYARNIFIGPEWNNQVVFKEYLDTEHPDLQEAEKLDEHIRHVKRAWAFDQKFEPKRLPKQP